MNGNPKQKNNLPKFNLYWLYAVLIISLMFMFFRGNLGDGGFDKEVPYTTFKEYVAKGYAKSVTVNKSDGIARFIVTPAHIRDVFHQGSDDVGTAPTVSSKVPSVDKVEDFLNVTYKGSVSYEESSHFWLNLLGSTFPFIILILFYFWMFRGVNGGGGGSGGSGGIFNVGKSKREDLGCSQHLQPISREHN